MEIFLLAIGWLLVGCAIAWIMGTAISVGEPSLGEWTSDQDALKSAGKSSAIEFAAARGDPETSLELSAAAATERRRLRGKQGDADPGKGLARLRR